MRMHVPAPYHSQEERQDACVLAVGSFGAPRSQGGAGDGGATWRTRCRWPGTRSGPCAQHHWRRRFSQRHLFDADDAHDAIAINLGKVHLERSRGFGAVWLGWLLWQALKLDELCEELLPPGRESVCWADVVAILVIARLCEPSSELHVAEQWYRTTALEDLLSVPAKSIYDERLYRTLDRLLPHKEAIEQHLVQRFGELFDLDYELLLYDVTSTYFGAPGQAWRFQRVRFPHRQGESRPPEIEPWADGGNDMS